MKFFSYSEGFVHKTFGPMMRIGQNSTRNFNLEKITAPTAFLYSSNDPHTNKQDIDLLRRSLAHNNRTHFKDYPDKNHIDFIWSKNAYKTVYPKIVELDSIYP